MDEHRMLVSSSALFHGKLIMSDGQGPELQRGHGEMGCLCGPAAWAGGLGGSGEPCAVGASQAVHVIHLAKKKKKKIEACHSA